MISIKRWLSILLFLCTLLLLECISNVAGGIGHEGEAKIYGKVVYADSDSIPTGASVFINVDTYIHLVNASQENRSPDAYIDESGNFIIDACPEGNYVIEINDGKNKAVSIHCEVRYGDTSVTLSPDTLRATSIICGRIIDSSYTISQLYMYLKGLERVAVVDTTNDSFTFYDIPSGSYEIVGGVNTTLNAQIEFGKLEIDPEDTLFVEYKYLADTTVKVVSKTITFNTSSSGADIMNNVYNIPVLIRLDQNTFDFSNTLEGGKDIYFTKGNGDDLYHEIEYWNSAEMNAAIWVRIDTVYGNRTSQSIIMHWGSHVAGSRESSHEVFDTSLGFQGVWHFSEINADTLADATANNFYGIPNALLPDVQGKIGYAKSFNGISDYITMPSTNNSILNFPENGTYSLSAWIFIKSSDTLFHSIVTKGNRMYGLQLNDSLEFFEYSETTSWNITNAKIDTGSWYYCTGVRNGESQYLYIDGVCVDSTIYTHGNLRNRVDTESLCIGNRVNSSEDGFFNGYIDEVRIHSRALDPDWIKLSYINQSNVYRFIRLR